MKGVAAPAYFTFSGSIIDTIGPKLCVGKSMFPSDYTMGLNESYPMYELVVVNASNKAIVETITDEYEILLPFQTDDKSIQVIVEKMWRSCGKVVAKL